MLSTPEIPSELLATFDQFKNDWFEFCVEEEKNLFENHIVNNETLLTQLKTAVVGSEFVTKQLLSLPNLMSELIKDDLNVSKYFSRESIDDYLEKNLIQDSKENFDKSLRHCRRRFMARIIWRDFNRIADLDETTKELSEFAAACIQRCVDYHQYQLSAQWGLPVDSAGNVQTFLVVGMGKLGAFELNVSSDIDLIFSYPDSGKTLSKNKILSNQEYFIRLGQKVIQSLDTVTVDGFVFRVDMRLRPYGQSGPLTANFDSFENYYQTQGREWERYAMIKARVVAQSSQQSLKVLIDELNLAEQVRLTAGTVFQEQLMALLQPFTYRRYVDYSAIDSMRAMKQLIQREVARKSITSDVKLGAGGIREVEFIVQIFQLIRGGRDLQLRERHLLTVLPMLAELGCLPDNIVTKLSEAYKFLRNTEHAIQGFQDQQSQRLPVDKSDCLRLAWLLGFSSWAEFQEQLQTHRDFVNQQFQSVIASPEKKTTDHAARSPEWELIWQGTLIEKAATQFITQQGIEDADTVITCLDELRSSRHVLSMQAGARDRLDTLMPMFLQELSQIENPSTSLQRICKVLDAVARRSAYIVLLVENPVARTQLLKLCAASLWVADQIAAHPVLLDELLDVRHLYSPPDVEKLRDELQRELLRYGWDDLENHMETLRYFRLSHALRVAACEVTGALPLMKVSDYLSNIAEVILQSVFELSWQQLIAKYGRPRRADGSVCDPGFVIVAYGKLGGIELGHGSDLDLVFVHNADSLLDTDGPKQIDNATFFARLGQKIIHILNTQTPSGQLYEVDMRLRPSGNSGLLVCSLIAFEKYQQSEAWVWEHQALVRARVVVGCDQLRQDFEELRKNVLCQPRDIAELREKVIDMRLKMRAQLGSKNIHGADGELSEQFHIKHDAGGIVDIEFMVQYAVLAWGDQHPLLAKFTDNIRILGVLAEADLMSREQVNKLIECYKTYRSTVHRLTLQGSSSAVSGEQFLEQRKEVINIWQQLMLS
ncbi:bifunctional [glutamate--ammonia ligase]-adenylyl-L-tyrosine phosphorylase/[glutamate--ammonia-ligase] adenylyltransferase [Aurantivibrio infirmus]